MVPYDTCRIYQIERAKSSAEVRRADEQAARVASAVSSLLRGITGPVRAVRRPSPVAAPGLPARPDRLACAKAAKGTKHNGVPGLA
jgi:hypothetical protein